MKKWIKLNEIGQLYIEIILVTFDVPLLFVCMDERKNRYLTLCIDEEEGLYLVSESESCLLLQMLRHQIPMDEAFRKADKSLYVEYDFSQQVFQVSYMNSENLTSDMLPDQGAYFELHNRKTEEYILKLQLENEQKMIYEWQIDKGSLYKSVELNYSCYSNYYESIFLLDKLRKLSSFRIDSNKIEKEMIVDVERNSVSLDGYSICKVLNKEKKYAGQMQAY